ncbi:MAG TPA: glycosyltransferase family 1 protein [Pyrinomonadaceae bacterium]
MPDLNGYDRQGSFNINYNKCDLVCFSHLRWDFVFQRPQHLLRRAGKDRRVFFVEEPIFDDGTMHFEVMERESGVKVVVPHLPKGLSSAIASNAVLHDLLNRFFIQENISDYMFWYYTPMALSFSADLKPRAIVYDCMDELSAFKGAHQLLRQYEDELFRQADLVFTGGKTLYEAKKTQHESVHCFPSSIDYSHFSKARTIVSEPDDQKNIPHPRLGFFGVVDERFDIELLAAVAEARPDWQFVILGPIVKIDPATLPNSSNIHYLGAKSYEELPDYIAGWDVALLLFADNEATRFISPTKTPEYLAAGKPVVSTPITDVVSPYGERGLVQIAATPPEFIAAAERALNGNDSGSDWLNRVDNFLASTSWDDTWARMSSLIDKTIHTKSTSLILQTEQVRLLAEAAVV